MNPLQVRLAGLRRRLRLIVSVRGISCILAVLVLIPVLGGLLDCWMPGHLPSIVRALLLMGTLAAAGCVAYHYLIRPLQGSTDDLSLALRVEAHYPVLNDALASAVQFLEQPPAADDVSSPSLRRQAVQQALGVAAGFDFRPAVDARGVRTAGLSMLVSLALALTLSLAAPQSARTALLRFTHPFGNHDWPRQTQLNVRSRDRIARGEAFDIEATVSGVVPERALVAFRFAGAGASEQVREVSRKGLVGTFTAHLEAGRVQREFEFQVRANDATFGWSHVDVLPPPQLVPLDGRPSPQVHLRPPAYTGLPDLDLPDGTSSIEAAAGSEVHLLAAVDRPVVRAWLEYPAELESSLLQVEAGTLVSAFTHPPAVSSAAGVFMLGTANAGRWKQMPVQLDPGGTLLSLAFPARMSGTFALHFEDDQRIGNTRLLDVRVVNDPPPTVHIERPSRSQDSFDLLPDAEITLQVQAEDPTYAVRSIYLEHRGKASDGAVSPVRKLPIYHHQAAETVLPHLLPSAGLHLLLPPLHLRPPLLDVQERWSLKGLLLQEGDVLILQACADDFDDVTVAKQPGRSEEVELHIVGKPALDSALDQAQTDVEQEIVRLRKEQQEALEKVIPAEKQWSNRTPLQPKHFDDLIQAEQIQEQMRSRVGTPQEGLRAQVNRILQTARDNHLPRSGTQDRMESVKGELDRLAREQLDQVSPRLTEARKAQEMSPGKPPTQEPQQKLLSDARKHQEEIEKTLGELLKLLEPWSSTHELKGEARSILQDQRKLQEQTGKLAKDLTGKEMTDLAPEERAKLEDAAERQNKLAERTSQMLEKLDRLGNEKSKARDAEAAQQLKDAARRGKENAAAENMQEATRSLQSNQLAEAGSRQNASIKAMEEVTRTLEDRREEELDRLVKKMRDVEKKLGDLADRQEELRKKAREASQIADPAKRQEVLKRLAREQAQLERDTQDAVRELSRVRMNRASQALSQAGSRMQRAGRQMEQGGNSDEQQEQALDRLNEAQQEVQQARQDTEEELAREKLARVADQIKGLKERQEPLLAESARIHRSVLEHKQWTRPLASSLRQLADAEAGLADETERLGKEKLESVKVFARLLQKSADAMRAASERMRRRLDRALDRAEKTPDGEEPSLDLPAEQSADADIQQAQRTSTRRFEQLLDALKPDNGVALRAGRSGSGGGGGGGRSGGNGDAIPPLSQLKALRALQEEINDRTKAFNKRHPDPRNLNAKETERLQGLRQEQQELEDLFHDVATPAETEGDKK
jgi:hypothetical protein